MQDRMFSHNECDKFKIIMVGDPYVGKTTLFWRYIEGQFMTDRSPTVTTIDFKIKQLVIDNTPVKLYIWDTAGQEKFRAIVSTYFKGCDGVMLVFDLSNAASFISVTTKWYQLSKSRSPRAQLMLVGNKSDMDLAFDEKQAELWAKDHGAVYVRTSVKRDINVNQCFRKLCEAIYRAPKTEKSPSFKLKKSPARQVKKNSCC